MVTLQESVNDLNRIVYEEGKSQSSARLRSLSNFVDEQLTQRGITSIEHGVELDAFVRNKSWDLVSREGDKPQIAISTKSILSNLVGTVPNRTDELIGEVADLQMRHPDVVTGYIVIVDTADTDDEPRRSQMARELDQRLKKISGRSPPSWGRGMVEASCVVKTNLAGPGDAQLVSDPAEIYDFFDTIVRQYRDRFTRGQQTLD